MEYFALIGVNDMVLKPLLHDTILPSISVVCVRGKNSHLQKYLYYTDHRRFRLHNGSNACSGLVEESTVNQNSWNPLQQTNVRPEVICTQLNCGSTGNFTNANGMNRLTCSGDAEFLALDNIISINISNHY